MYATARNFYVRVLHYRASLIEFMNPNPFAQVSVTFVGNPRFNIEPLVFKEVFRQFLEAGWP
jgi:hypothetical protein